MSDETSDSEQAERDDINYVKGSRAALRSMLAHVLRELGYEDTEATRAKWILEREEAISMLRRVCDDFGDNDWTEQLHLADVIDKHLARYLEANDGE